MNRKARLHTIILCCLLFTPWEVCGQIRVYPLPHAKSERHSWASRTEALSPASLPFWDDFSTSTLYPIDTLWEYGQTVTINPGMGINQPTLNVATFDGLDERGLPYSQNNVLAKGITDSLISRPLRLDEVTGLGRDSVYLSFFYQYRGNGEPPDPEDKLTVSFLDTAHQWIKVWTADGNPSLPADSFLLAELKLDNDAYYHGEFRFRIQSEGRQSGPYDTWNIDYIYLNRGRSTNDIIPDRAIADPLSSLFQGYWSLPLDHYLAAPLPNTLAPSFVLLNLKNGFSQPINYTSWTQIDSYTGGVKGSIVRTLDTAYPIGTALDPFERTTVTLNTLPDTADIDGAADSVVVFLKVGVSTKDNIPPASAGDYLPGFEPIDFRVNDTTDVKYTLANYYAHDDGTAEYGAGLNLPGGQLAYRFDMAIAEPDTVVAIDFYFPEFGNPANQVIRLFLLKDLLGNSDSELHSESPVTIQRTGNNNFYTHNLQRPVGVQNTFYVGWQQSTASDLAVGLDKNSGSGDMIYYNTTGIWIQNTAVTGSLMIRPRFGKGEGVITGIAENQEAYVHPNPAGDYFTVNEVASGLRMVDVTGRYFEVPFYPGVSETRVEVSGLASGLYVVIYTSRSGPRRQKIIITR